MPPCGGTVLRDLDLAANVLGRSWVGDGWPGQGSAVILEFAFWCCFLVLLSGVYLGMSCLGFGPASQYLAREGLGLRALLARQPWDALRGLVT